MLIRILILCILILLNRYKLRTSLRKFSNYNEIFLDFIWSYLRIPSISHLFSTYSLLFDCIKIRFGLLSWILCLHLATFIWIFILYVIMKWVIYDSSIRSFLFLTTIMFLLVIAILATQLHLLFVVKNMGGCNLLAYEMIKWAKTVLCFCLYHGCLHDQVFSWSISVLSLEIVLWLILYDSVKCEHFFGLN